MKEENISPTPVIVTLAGATGMVLEPNRISDLVKELLGVLFRVRGIHGDS
jgi:hypothetical protein